MSDHDDMMAGLSSGHVNELIAESCSWQSRALAAEQKLESLSNVLMNINDTCRVRGFAAGLGNPTDQRVIDMIQASEKACVILKANCETAEQERDKALALVASYDRQDELIGTEFEGVDEVTEVIRLLKEERDQLKSELQQAREAFSEIDLEVQKMGELNGVHFFMDIRASKLRAILERIEKENNSPH